MIPTIASFFRLFFHDFGFGWGSHLSPQRFLQKHAFYKEGRLLGKAGGWLRGRRRHHNELLILAYVSKGSCMARRFEFTRWWEEKEKESSLNLFPFQQHFIWVVNF